MLFFPDSSRKASAIASSLWMLMLTLMPTIDALATDSAFTAGQNTGNAGVQQSLSVFSNPSSLNNLGMTGLGSQQSPSSITQYYVGGKNSASTIGTINSAGSAAAMQAQTNCLANDPACKARQVGAKTYQNMASGSDPRAKYTAGAKAMLHAANQQNPLSVLGIGLPNSNAGNVCVQSTTNTPAYNNTESCLKATFQTLHSLPTYPVTTTYSYTSPYCIDPTYTLNSSQTLCEKTTYSCPNGGTLNGTSCVITTAPTITYSGCATAQAGGSWTQYIANGQDWWNVQAMCAPDGVNIQVYANAAGGWGNCGAPGSGYWNVMPIASYSGKVTHISTPSWNGSCQAFATKISGGCSNGTCTYQVSFDWANYLGTQCVQYHGSFQPVCSQSWMHYYSGYASDIQNAINTGSVQSGFSPVATLSFPQNAIPNCPSGSTLTNGQCVSTYPATANYSSASPGCLGAPMPAGNVTNGGTKYIPGTQTGGIMTCQTTIYSCPASSNINLSNMRCEDPTKPSYQNPNCKYLGIDTNIQGETYLCLNNKLDECANLNLTSCTQTGSSCIFTDNVVGSDTYGQCIATQYDYSCPSPSKPVSITSCGYQPMCFNGNCFTPPGSNCTGTTTTQTTTQVNSCNVITPQVYRQCSLVEQINAQGAVTGYTAGSDCSSINTQGGVTLSCTQIPPLFDSASGHYPKQLNYSCLGTQDTSDCNSFASNASCTKQPPKCLEYECLDPLPLLNGTQDQAGQYSSTVVGTTQTQLGTNTCTNKGACINEQDSYSCMATSTTPGDQCITDLSQVLVSMEAGRQAGTYLDPNSIKVFSGDTDKCDRNAFSFFGANLGSKSCCNIDAPDAKSNNEILGSSLAQSAGFSILKQGVSKASSYMYDYAMSSNMFMEAGNSAWAAGLMSDSAQAAQASAADLAAKGIQNFTWTPSVSVAGVTASFGGVGTGVAGTGSWVGKMLSKNVADMLTPSPLGTMSTPFGDLTFSVDPVSLGVQAAWMAWQAYNAALACDDEDYKSATKTNGKLCYSTGTWCEHKDCSIFGCTCTKFRTGKCCYNSKLSRIINQQGRPQLGLDMRDCSGFTVDQLKQLDWSKIDLSEFIADMLAQAQASTANVVNNALPALQSQTSTITKNNAANGTQPNIPVRQ